MHDRFRIPTFHTAPPIRCKPIKNALPNRPTSTDSPKRQSAIPIALFINCRALVFDAFGEELEELLGILVFAGGEEGVDLGFAAEWGVVGEGLDDF